jgi:FkbM family methyltransferase
MNAPVVETVPMPTTNPFVLVEDTRYGRFLVPPTDKYVGQALIQYGEYSQEELDVVLQLVHPETRVIAVGANLGAMVVPIAKKAIEVVAFEPQRWVFSLLCANVALNGLVNVRPYWAAVGRERGILNVPLLDPTRENNFGALELETVQHIQGDQVPVYTLDSMPDMGTGLITIDVEGMELDVLQGGERLIRDCQPVIWFEADRELKRGDVFKWLRARNYDLYWHRVPLYRKDNYKQNTTNLFQGDNGIWTITVNVVAVPKSRDIKLTGFPPVEE